MPEKKIKILGEEVTIAFNMAVEIEYEEMTGAAFDLDKLAEAKTKGALQLSAAAIKANNPDTAITYKRLTKEAGPVETATLINTTVDALKEWLRVPEVYAKEVAEDTEADTEDGPKN